MKPAYQIECPGVGIKWPGRNWRDNRPNSGILCGGSSGAQAVGGKTLNNTICSSLMASCSAKQPGSSPFLLGAWQPLIKGLLVIQLKPKANWKKFSNGQFPGDWYQWGDVRVCVAKESGLWHISISVPYRYPTWDEIYTAWYDLVPGAGSDFNGAIFLPRKSEYVNIHPNCFHVHQLQDAEIPAGVIL